MGLMGSIVEKKASRTEIGEVVPIPVLRTNRKTGISTSDDLAAFEASYRENDAACEVALSRGLLPDPEAPVDQKTLDVLLSEFKAGKMNLVELTRKRFKPFIEADTEAFKAYQDKLKSKYKALEKEDLKKRPLGALAYN